MAAKEGAPNGQQYAAGDVIWNEGEQVSPIRIQQGIVVHRRDQATMALLGPGDVVMPLPGIKKVSTAATTVVAITTSVVTPIKNADKDISQEELERSVHSLINGAYRLGSLTISQRLAALLLDITEMQGHPVIHARQDIIAMGVGSRRETVAVVLSQWRDYDWIQTRYRRVKVVHREALHQIAIGGTPPPGVISF